MGVRSLRSFFGLSLAIHAILMLFCAFLAYQQAHQRASAPILIELEPLPRDPGKRKNQVVQSSRGQETQTPSKDAYLGERNQSVDRETVSRSQLTEIGSADKKQKATRGAKKLTEPKTLP